MSFIEQSGSFVLKIHKGSRRNNPLIVNIVYVNDLNSSCLSLPNSLQPTIGKFEIGI